MLLIFTQIFYFLISGAVSVPTVYDQRQTGVSNVRVDIKDAVLIAVADELGDYDYTYDYSDLTIKPEVPSSTSRPVTAKPESSTSISGPITAKPEHSPSTSRPVTAKPESSTSISGPITAKPEHSPSTSRPVPAKPEHPSSTFRPVPAKPERPSSTSRPVPAKPEHPSSTSRPVPAKPERPSSTSRPVPAKPERPSSTSRPGMAKPEVHSTTFRPVTTSPGTPTSQNQNISVIIDSNNNTLMFLKPGNETAILHNILKSQDHHVPESVVQDVKEKKKLLPVKIVEKSRPARTNTTDEVAELRHCSQGFFLDSQNRCRRLRKPATKQN